MIKATNSKKISSTRSLQHLAYFQPYVHSDFRAYTSSHYTTQQSFDPSCMMEGLGEVQAVHPCCHTGLMWR